jgi:hypothetical protein
LPVSGCRFIPELFEQSKKPLQLASVFNFARDFLKPTSNQQPATFLNNHIYKFLIMIIYKINNLDKRILFINGERFYSIVG